MHNRKKERKKERKNNETGMYTQANLNTQALDFGSPDQNKAGNNLVSSYDLIITK